MQHTMSDLETVLHISQNRKMSPILTLFAILEIYVMETYFMKALFADNEFCKEEKHDSLRFDESSKELLIKNRSIYEQ